MSDQRFQQWLDDIDAAIDGDTEAKENLDQAVYQARREIQQRGEMIEDLANERDRYRNSVYRVKTQLENVLEEDAASLGRLEDEVRDLYRELDDLDIDPDDSTYGKGVFNVFDSDRKSRRGFIRDGLAAATLLGVGYGANEARKASNKAGAAAAAPQNEETGIEEGNWYGFQDIDSCLSESQENTFEENLNDPLDEHQYRFERSGDSRSKGWDIYVRSGQGTEEIGKLEGQEIYCEVR